MTVLHLQGTTLMARTCGRDVTIQRVTGQERYEGLIKMGWTSSVAIAALAGLITLKEVK